MEFFRRYPYAPSTKRWAKAAAIYLSLATVSLLSLTGTREPLDAFGLFSISPFIPMLLVAIGGGYTLKMGVYAAIALVNSLRAKQEIILTRDAVTAPKSDISRKRETLAFSDITTHKVFRLGKHRRVYVLTHENGCMKIDESCCGSREVFEDIMKRINNSIASQKTLAGFANQLPLTLN